MRNNCYVFLYSKSHLFNGGREIVPVGNDDLPTLLKIINTCKEES